MNRIYLDHAATTPLDPRVRQAMEPWQGPAANPSSLHTEGRAARQALDGARQSLAEVLGCLFGEVIFTGSGTEAAALALVGAALGRRDPARTRILVSAAEHHCVLETAPLLERLGVRQELIPVCRRAQVRLDALESLMGPDVLAVSVMHANNELGTINPIAEAAALAKRHGALMHVDAVQTFPGPRLDAWPEVDMISASAHKLHGPAGIGLLACRAGTPLGAVIRGGGQEREMRAGTESVANAVGFAAAAQLALTEPDGRAAARDAFLQSLEGRFEPTAVGEGVLPGHAHLRIPGIAADSMLIRLDSLGVSASSGAACSSGALEPSHVLLACGYTPTEAEEGLRFTFGRGSQPAEAEEAARRVASAARAIDQAARPR
jgi:cysteine desulfurase